MSSQTTRRRFIGITAAVSAAALMPRAFGKSPIQPVVWQGIALGAAAELRLYHPDRSHAQNLIKQAIAETERLEKIFSLYRDDSEIVRLNRQGSLKTPSGDLLAVLAQSKAIHSLTQGAFDPTIQTLWQQHARHFTQNPDSRTAPEIQAALARTGMQHLHISPQHIAFGKRGMALTLNGIAQGHITDRITQILQQGGLQHALVNMGELRHLDTLKQHPETAKIQNPNGTGTLAGYSIPLQNQALATSGGYGTQFDRQGRFTHLIDPRSGSSRPRHQSVSVLADTAAVADALSTAFAVSSEAQIRAAARQAQVQVWLVRLDGSVQTIV